MLSKKFCWTTVTLCALSTAALVWVAVGKTLAEDAPKKAQPIKSLVMRTFMKVKLAQAQAILEGLTVEDFDQIEKNAAAMFLLTKAEQWNASKDAQFVQHSKEFERVTTKLAKYASEKNLEGASLMYVQLTLNCVDCHRFVRDKGIQARKQPDEKVGED